MRYLYFLLICSLAACSSNKYAVKQVDAEIDPKGKVSNATVGLDKNGVAIIQKESFADDELRAVKWKNNSLEDELKNQNYWLARCREEIADPRLGGNGEVTELPDIDDMKTINQAKEELGLVDDSLKIIKREKFVEALQAERKYSNSLKTMIKTVKKNKKSCERRMGYARLKVGLPKNRYQGKHKINSKGQISKTIIPHENNLDDAFAIQMLLRDRFPATE